jgi:hypothetical protein
MAAALKSTEVFWANNSVEEMKRHGKKKPNKSARR